MAGIESSRILIPVVAVVCFLILACAGYAEVLVVDTLERNEEPVVVTGNMIPDIVGARTDRIFVYAYQDDHWEKVLFQIDEVTDDGSYFDEDETPGILDENDEIVFMAEDCGDSVGMSEWVEGANPDVRHVITVTDGRPGCGDNRAWAYIYTATELTPKEDDYVEVTNYWDWKITTPCHVQNFEDWYPHILDEVYIRPGGGGDSTDIVDRQKTRNSIRGFVTTENNLADDIDPNDIVDGPIRVMGHFSGVLDQWKVTDVNTMFYKAYALVFTTIITEFFPVGLDYIRYSVDFKTELEGMCHYNNGGEGFLQDAIDGSDPGFPVLPQETWVEVNHPTAGTFVQIQDFSNAPIDSVDRKLFYQDGGVDPSGIDTGEDQVCWGEAGVMMYNVPKGLRFTVETWTFFLPARTGESVGATYASYFYYPLIVTSEKQHVVSDNLVAEAREEGNHLSWSCSGSVQGDFRIHRGVIRRLEDSVEIGRVSPAPSADRYHYFDRDARIAGETVYYWICSETGVILGPARATWVPVAKSCMLYQNAPNPCNPMTTIPFEIGGEGASVPVGLRLYNVKGEMVRILCEKRMLPGRYSVVWDGRNQDGELVSAGIYLCRLVSPGGGDMKKILLVK